MRQRDRGAAVEGESGHGVKQWVPAKMPLKVPTPVAHLALRMRQGLHALVEKSTITGMVDWRTSAGNSVAVMCFMAGDAQALDEQMAGRMPRAKLAGQRCWQHCRAEPGFGRLFDRS